MSFIPKEARIRIVQPIMPIRLIAVLDLCLTISRIFQRVPKESLWKNLVFSISIGLTFFGVYGRRASAAVPASIFLTDKYPIRVRISTIATIIAAQNPGITNFHSGRSRYVPIIPFGFIIIRAIRNPKPIPSAVPIIATKNANEV